ncbi:unnamed protein product [Trichogramma brassicae]|uniref:Uncharacterized protein n=1 Tax=Trichogramma brassicae TaxID=86971 RepID=A0A6H5HXA3_9HYME|nr:unnamed protein product [Trichogramma brassicae]
MYETRVISCHEPSMIFFVFACRARRRDQSSVDKTRAGTRGAAAACTPHALLCATCNRLFERHRVCVGAGKGKIFTMFHRFFPCTNALVMLVRTYAVTCYLEINIYFCIQQQQQQQQHTSSRRARRTCCYTCDSPLFTSSIVVAAAAANRPHHQRCSGSARNALDYMRYIVCRICRTMLLKLVVCTIIALVVFIDWTAALPAGDKEALMNGLNNWIFSKIYRSFTRHRILAQCCHLNINFIYLRISCNKIRNHRNWLS